MLESPIFFVLVFLATFFYKKIDFRFDKKNWPFGNSSSLGEENTSNIFVEGMREWVCVCVMLGD